MRLILLIVFAIVLVVCKEKDCEDYKINIDILSSKLKEQSSNTLSKDLVGLIIQCMRCDEPNLYACTHSVGQMVSKQYSTCMIDCVTCSDLEYCASRCGL